MINKSSDNQSVFRPGGKGKMSGTKAMKIKEKLNNIREPKPQTKTGTVLTALFSLASGTALGIFSKWLDDLELDSAVRWHRFIEATDLGNFFSDIAVWLAAALIIAVFSRSALRAALNVFVFFAGMCAAYHIYTVVFSGFNPSSYMMIWYAVTALSPLLAAACWYAKGKGAISTVLSAEIIAVLFLSCFSIGFFYIDLKGILYLIVFCVGAAVIYNNPKQFFISLPAGIITAFIINPIWPFR